MFPSDELSLLYKPSLLNNRNKSYRLFDRFFLFIDSNPFYNAIFPKNDWLFWRVFRTLLIFYPSNALLNCMFMEEAAQLSSGLHFLFPKKFIKSLIQHLTD